MATRDSLITDAKAATDHEAAGDEQIGTSVWQGWVADEYQAVRRLLRELAPTLYIADTTFTITSGNTWSIVPTDWDSLYRLQRLGSDGYYFPLDLANPLDPEDVVDDWAFLERGTVLEIYPSTSATGSYKATYVQTPSLSGNYTLSVPGGIEAIIRERVAARARTKLDEDPSAHMQMAKLMWDEQAPALRRRYGLHRHGLMQRR